MKQIQSPNHRREEYYSQQHNSNKAQAADLKLKKKAISEHSPAKAKPNGKNMGQV